MLARVEGSLVLNVNGAEVVVPASKLRFGFVERQRLPEGEQRYYVAPLELPGIDAANVCLWECPAGRFERLDLDAPLEVELKQDRLAFTFQA